MKSLPRRKLHRLTFLAAGIYNVAWGFYSMADPQAFFRFAEMELPNHPEIFVCLGMVIGLYGVLYLDVTRRPESGWLIAAVGMTGKVLGPIGALILVGEGRWPVRALAMIIFNDVIWWGPFGLYLFDSWRYCRRSRLNSHM